MATVNGIRIVLYVTLWLFAAVLLGLTAQRIHYTTHVPFGDPVNGGESFYDPIIAELLATSAITLIWIPFVMHVLCGKGDYGIFGTFAGELLGLFTLFMLWIVGASISSSFWGDLSWCHQFLPCRVLTVILAFAWMGWIIIFTLFIISLLCAIMNDAFWRPLHARYDPRGSTYVPRGSRV
ncbi:hypothetical protein QCA50_019153 [Cerrena zonata]|uniref:MARVEL domain-containing protein n=1 Tax=Cerrena zonata TaxID=2478898 RepID=A0AAW0FBT0_9APHY